MAPSQPGVRHGLSERLRPDVPSTRPARVPLVASAAWPTSGIRSPTWRRSSAHGELVLVRGDGVRVWDESGRRYLDATAGLWFCERRLRPKGHRRRGRRPDGRAPRLLHFGDFSNRPASELAERVASLAPVTDSRVFLTSGGSDSIDTATKMARRFWQLVGQPERTILIRRETRVPRDAHRGHQPGGHPGKRGRPRRADRGRRAGPWDDADDLAPMIEQVGAGQGRRVLLRAGDRRRRRVSRPRTATCRPPAPCAARPASSSSRTRSSPASAAAALVRERALGARTRHHHVREGHHQRLPADGRRDRCARGSPSRSGRRAQASGGTATPIRATRRVRRRRSPISTSWSARASASELGSWRRSSPTRWRRSAAHPLVSEVRTAGVLGAVQLAPATIADDPALPARTVAACRESGVLTRALAPGALQIFTGAGTVDAKSSASSPTASAPPSTCSG